jgi:hypothetical protein
MNIFIVPTVGGVLVVRGDDEAFRPMTAAAMMVLAERLIAAARETLKAENETSSYAEAVHALR